MYDLSSSSAFDAWIKSLPNQARAKALAKVRQLGLGNDGDAKTVGKGVRELRIHAGPGYRIYFKRVGASLILLLAGGEKSRQGVDIKRAIAIAESYEQQP